MKLQGLCGQSFPYFPYPQTSTGMDSKGDSCCSMPCYWLISEIGKLFSACNGDFCSSGWLMNCLSDRHFISQPLEQKFPLQAEKKFQIQKPEYRTLQTKQSFFLYSHCLSEGQFISQPLEQKSPLKAEKNFPISEIYQ